KGRLCLSNQGNYSTHFNGIPYCVFTPIWFYDFFCINRFVDCQVYATIWDLKHQSSFVLNHEHALRKWGLGFVKPVVSEFHIQITIFAERDEDSTYDQVPTQHVYRSTSEWEAYEAVVQSFVARNRKPHIRSGRSKTEHRVPPGWWYILPDWSVRNPETNQ